MHWFGIAALAMQMGATMEDLDDLEGWLRHREVPDVNGPGEAVEYVRQALEVVRQNRAAGVTPPPWRP